MKPKHRARVSSPPQPSPAAAPLAGPAEAAGTPSPRLDAPGWGETLRLILWAAVALFACALLWVIWTRRMLIIFSAAGIIWVFFALAAVFDHLWRRGDRGC